MRSVEKRREQASSCLGPSGVCESEGSWQCLCGTCCGLYRPPEPAHGLTLSETAFARAWLPWGDGGPFGGRRGQNVPCGLRHSAVCRIHGNTYLFRDSMAAPSRAAVRSHRNQEDASVSCPKRRTSTCGSCAELIHFIATPVGLWFCSFLISQLIFPSIAFLQA